MIAAPDRVPRPPLVVVRDVSKRYNNGMLALQSVDLVIDEGSFVSVIGPSGCGKSTLLRLIAGLGQPSTGAIERRGARPAAPGVTERDVAFVFQDPTLMPWRSAIGNVMLPLTLAGMPRAAARALASEALGRVGLADFTKVFPRELSGGMKMRVSIARALVTRPRLLLLDEPFAALDEISRVNLNKDLLALWQELKFTAVFVTHSVLESVYLSERVVVMAGRPGRMIADHLLEVPAAARDDGFRTSVVYYDHVRTVSASLAKALAT